MRESVNVDFIPGLPEEPFRGGVGNYEGVVMHATDVFGDRAEGERNYELGHFADAFVHTFSDESKTLQVAPYEYKAWGAGHSANERFLHNELCQVQNDGSADAAAKFKASYDNWIMTAAEQLAAKNLGVTKAQPDGSGTLWSHHDVTHILGNTTHEDPIEYLSVWGLTWDNVVNDVTYLYDNILNPAPAPVVEAPAPVVEAPAPVVEAPAIDQTMEAQEPEIPAGHIWHIRPGDTLDKIGAELSLPALILQKFNELQEGAGLPAFIRIPSVYRIKSGDTLSGICSKHDHENYHFVASVNGIDPNVIYVGQMIYL